MTAQMTIISTFDDEDVAARAIDALRGEGFGQQEVTLLDAQGDRLEQELTLRGFGDEDRRYFVEAAGEGKALVCARVTEDRADRAAAILDRFERPEDGEDHADREERTVPIVEEKASVAKSRSATGGARVTTKVRERPIQESVTLREEHVDAERRSADRALRPEEADAAFEEKSVEMMGLREEAEIRKEARVVGEVALTKETETREETLQDSVRRTEVEIEKVDADTNGSKR
jgi:stress response protein YsnF